MTSWLPKILGRHFHQARSRHLRPLAAKVVSPALSVVCAGDSLQITCKREALQKIKWNERPKACRNIVSPFSSLPDRTLYFDLRPRFCYVSGIAHRKLYGNMLFLNMFEACLSAWFTKVPPDHLHGWGHARHANKLTSRSLSRLWSELASSVWLTPHGSSHDMAGRLPADAKIGNRNRGHIELGSKLLVYAVFISSQAIPYRFPRSWCRLP